MNTRYQGPPPHEVWQAYINWYIWDAPTQAALQARWERAIAILNGEPWYSHILNDQEKEPQTYIIPANTGRAAGYLYYQTTAYRCTCPDATSNAPLGWCKHRIAVWLHSQQYIKINRQAIDLDELVSSVYGPTHSERR